MIVALFLVGCDRVHTYDEGFVVGESMVFSCNGFSAVALASAQQQTRCMMEGEDPERGYDCDLASAIAEEDICGPPVVIIGAHFRDTLITWFADASPEDATAAWNHCGRTPDDDRFEFMLFGEVELDDDDGSGDGDLDVSFSFDEGNIDMPDVVTGNHIRALDCR